MTDIESKPQFYKENNVSILESNLCLRINESDIFHSEKDRNIAIDFLAQIKNRLIKGLIEKDKYELTLGALDNLIPKKDENGNRQIADIKITPYIEKLIRSRIDSKEVEATSKHGSWGKLPEEVKRQIIKNNNLTIKMTTNCTVGCPFCAFAKKGLIKEKMSFKSVVEIIKYFKNNQTPPLNMEKLDISSSDISQFILGMMKDIRNKKVPSSSWKKSDELHFSTDPFDIKWMMDDEEEKNYNDIASLYWNLMPKEKGCLSTSTAIPIGEELSILKFANDFIQKRESGKIGLDNSFRISQTKVNAKRVQYLKNILEALYDNNTIKKLINIQERTSENTTSMGPKIWENKKDMSLKDILENPADADCVVIGVQSVNCIIPVVISNERPEGIEKFPLVKKMDDGTVHYSILHYQLCPNPDESEPQKRYSDPIITKIIIDKGGKQTIKTEKISDNPHRVFLRIAESFNKLGIQQNGLKNITKQDKFNFHNQFLNEIQIVKSYLDLGAKNNTMTLFMDFLKDNGFIE